MSSEDKVQLIYEVMEKAIRDLEDARKKVRSLYPEIKDDVSMCSPELCGVFVDHTLLVVDIAFFVCQDELFEDAFKTLSRVFATFQGDDDWLSALDIIQQSMLYKLCLCFSYPL